MAAPSLTPSEPSSPDAGPSAELRGFLVREGWGNARIEPIPGDASARRYWRVADNERRAIVMDAPSPDEDVRPFMAMALYLEQEGVPAPSILGADEQRGLLLLSDLGDRRMREAVETDAALERPVYEAAVDLLVRLRGSPPADVPAYDDAVLHREADLFVDWWAPAAGVAADRRGWTAAWAGVFVKLSAPSVTVLRDYHSENIMLTQAEEFSGGLALLDFQDALVGHPAYDLVSLLQDARRDVPRELEAAMLDRYRAATGEGEAFDAAYALLGAQRNAKILGIFARLSRRDGKHRYLAMMPRVWGHLRRDLAHPLLGPVAEWFASNVPDDVPVARP